MNLSPMTVTKDETLATVIKMMVEEKTNSLVVINKDEKPIGLISTHALIKEIVPSYLQDDPLYSQFGVGGTLKKYVERAKNDKVSDFMITNFHTLTLDDYMIEAASYTILDELRTLPVVDKDGKIAGTISRTAIKKCLYDSLYNVEEE